MPLCGFVCRRRWSPWLFLYGLVGNMVPFGGELDPVGELQSFQVESSDSYLGRGASIRKWGVLVFVRELDCIDKSCYRNESSIESQGPRWDVEISFENQVLLSFGRLVRVFLLFVCVSAF